MTLSASTKGLIFGLLAYTLWATTDCFSKLAFEHGATPIQLLGLNTFFGISFFVLKTSFEGNIRKLIPYSMKFVTLRAASNLGVALCFFTAYRALPLANAYIVEYTAPFVTSIGAALFLKEHLSKQKIALIFLGFFGALVAINPTLLVQNGAGYGYLAAFGGSVFFSLSQLVSRHLSKSETPEAIMFMSNLVGFFVAAFFIPSLDSLEPIVYLFSFLACCVGIAGGYLMIKALSLTTSAPVSILHYTQFIPGAIYGFFIWNTFPNAHLLLGGLIVVATGILLIRVKDPKPTPH